MTRDELAKAIESGTDALVFDSVRVPLPRSITTTPESLAMAEAIRFLLPDVEIRSAFCPGPRSLLLVLPWGLVLLGAPTYVAERVAQIEAQISLFSRTSGQITATLTAVSKYNGRGVATGFEPRQLHLVGLPVPAVGDEVASGVEIPVETVGHFCRAMLQALGDRA